MDLLQAFDWHCPKDKMIREIKQIKAPFMFGKDQLGRLFHELRLKCLSK